jgi:hypothetical protein
MPDTKATALTTATILEPADLLIGVDISDTTMAGSGTTKRFSPAIITAGLPIFGASGGSHAQGLVPDPGASAGTTRYLREDATWFVPPGGGGGTPGGSTGQLQYNNAGAFGGLTNWALGAGGQITGTPIADPGAPLAGDMWVSSTQKAYSRLNSGCVVRDGGVIWVANGPGTAIANTTTPTSLFAGIASSVGSLTIPANSLVAGKILRLRCWGLIGYTATSPTLTLVVTLGSTTVATSTANGMPATAQTGAWWLTPPSIELLVQTAGASGKVLGGGVMTIVSQAMGGVSSLYMDGNAGTLAQTNLDTTAALTLDMKATWNVASPSNTIQLLGAMLEIAG